MRCPACGEKDCCGGDFIIEIEELKKKVAELEVTLNEHNNISPIGPPIKDDVESGAIIKTNLDGESK